MPLYGFRCRRCGFAFDVSRPAVRADEPAACPADGGEAVRVADAPARAPEPPTVPERRGHRHPPGTRRHDAPG